MKYADLIQFQPIETVVQLREADAEAVARRLVETFVISKGMAAQLVNVVIHNLQFQTPSDNKGLLVVGNYGTGKSHLMALISAIAQHAEMADLVSDPSVRQEVGQIAGRFQVVRSEVGSTLMSLRDIVCAMLEEGLEDLGVTFSFPPATAVTNNKDSLVEMMEAFQQKFPGQGLLLVLDELLDYLRTRTEQALILDLNFMREIGEVCKNSRFRFVAGVQESLFDSPRFQFVAETLLRVKDRYESVRIVRDDVEHVVAQRLLKKTPEQQARIREHLQQFAPLYAAMNERMDDYVRLFPVHPTYLETFERVSVAEKREVLRTLSDAIRHLVDRQVPPDEPGLIAYDSYWDNLRQNVSFRSIPEIREVLDKSLVLEDRIQHAFVQPRYKPVALRIIHALSVHRLTTSDIYAPLGATAEELRDDLCLILPVPEKNADFVKTLVEKVLVDIVRTVSGQFLTYNKGNSQYYLDLKKDIDFDSLIEKRGRSLDESTLDSYYFRGLTRIMECADQTYVSGYRIWEHELEWRERKAGRSGYLFFGAPNERSTAQPVRDFYLYCLQPFDRPYFKDEKRPDEVFFELVHRDEAFEEALRLFAGAGEQSKTASGENKRIYDNKAGDHLKALTAWLRDHMTRAFEVTHQGRRTSLDALLQGHVHGGAGRMSVRDLVNLAGGVCLAPHFENRSPDYPNFGVLVTRENREQAAAEALRWIAGGVKSRQGTAVLEALELLDGETLKPRRSRYARHILEELGAKGPGQVLNRSELVSEENGVEYWTRFRLEPEFLGVVLAALTHSGDLVVSLPGKKVGAGAVEQFARTPIREVVDFKHVERPKGLPVGPLSDLFELLGLQKGLIVNEATREKAVQDLQIDVTRRVERLVMAEARLQEGLQLWGRPVLAGGEMEEWRGSLRETKNFLESLQAFNTVGKLNNFPHDSAQVASHKDALDRLKEVEDLVRLIQDLTPMASYLSTAEAVLPSGHAWIAEVQDERADLLSKVANSRHRSDAGFQRALGQRLARLKSGYQDAYLELHRQARLGPKEDEKKAGLTRDPRLLQLQKLDGVDMMPHHQLKDFQNRLFQLKTCFSLSRQDLEASPTCPHDHYRPVEAPPGPLSAAQIVADLDDELERMVDEWTRALLANLDDPTVEGNVDLLTDPAGREALREFRRRRELPEPVTPAFVKALQDALTGLERVTVTGADLHKAVAGSGGPCTVEELRERLDQFLAGLTKGKDVKKIRVVVE